LLDVSIATQFDYFLPRLIYIPWCRWRCGVYSCIHYNRLHI